MSFALFCRTRIRRASSRGRLHSSQDSISSACCIENANDITFAHRSAKAAWVVVSIACFSVGAGDESADSELARLRLENDRLRSYVQTLEQALPSTGPVTTQSPAVITEIQIEWWEFTFMCLAMVLVGMLPFVYPFKDCCRTRLHRVYPMMFVVYSVILIAFFYVSQDIAFNDAFFLFVSFVEIAITGSKYVLYGILFTVTAVCVWKLKDRILATLGIDNVEHYIGQPSDWATCWSMRRFAAGELLVWKVENLPSASGHTSNNLFVEVKMGYNVTTRTRVHLLAGHTCVVKERLQFNYDPHDLTSVMKISVHSQQVIGATEISSIELSTTMLNNLQKPALADRTVGWASGSTSAETSAWFNHNSFKTLDMIPSGTIYMSFVPVEEQVPECCPELCCCFPTSPPKKASGYSAMQAQDL